MTDAIEKAKAIIAEGKQIDAPLALKLLKVQLAKKPEGFVYTDPQGFVAGSEDNFGCFNLHPIEPMDTVKLRDLSNLGGKGTAEGFVPGCIVGAVFADVVGIENTPIGGGAYGTNQDTGSPFNGHAIYVLGRAQQSQDNGNTWAAAVASAEQAVRDA